jgi:hypothetical protein
MLANIMNTAGERDYRLENPKPDQNFAGFTFSDGRAGYLVAARGNTKLPDEYSSEVIAKWSELCKGDLASTKQSIPSTNGAVARKLFVTCREVANSFIVETLVVRRPNGLLLELATIQKVSGSSPPASSDKSSGALLDAALMTSIDR